MSSALIYIYKFSAAYIGVNKATLISRSEGIMTAYEFVI